jgi:alcohol dehydrogenase
MSIVGVHNVSLGLSHAIGHQLGALGVPHGVTSCIMLPHVMRFLAPATREEQERIAAALRKGLGVQEGSAADLIDRLFNQLGVPRRISQFNVSRDKMNLIAEATMADVVARESPVPINREIIVGLLEKAW